MKAWFVSDIHLRDINERNSVILLRFLHSLLKDSETTHLFLLGDIFDLWVGDSDVFQAKFQTFVDAIVDVKKMGVEVVYFEGNHDVHVKGFWENKFSIPVWADAKSYQLGSWKVRLEHGDFINPHDEKYLKYREFIRRPALEKLAYIIPGKLLDEVGIAASKLSRKKSSMRRRDSEQQLRQMIRDYAVAKFREEKFDLMITGHMHIRDDHEFESQGSKGRSINLGSWFEDPQALCLTDNKYTWIDLQKI